MVKKTLSTEELESMSYTDVANYVLEQNNKKMKIEDLFMSVIKLRGDDPDKIFESKIGDFFSLISTDKRFVMLDKGYWDLRVNHKNKIDLSSDDEEDDDEEIVDDTIDDDSNEDDKIDYDESYDPDDDPDDDDLSGLVVIDNDEETEE